MEVSFTGRTTCVYTILIVLFLSPVAWSQDANRSTTAERTAVVTAITSTLSIDGSLDESPWQTAPRIGDLVQREPDNGEAPSQRTEVILLHDADNLYIGVMCFDSEPDRIAASQMGRDAGLGSDDRITILLDTYRDQRNAFYFQTNAVGALVDGLVFANGQSNTDWDAIWKVRTRRTKDGWSVEMAIPFKSLGFSTFEPVWGFNIARNIPRRSEEDRWSGARLQVTQFFQVSEAGEIASLTGLTQGIGLDVRPFAGARWLHAETTGTTDFSSKPGFDLFYNFTPSLKLSATVNTDFGETEVDARQINLSRFSILFPEKRAFFLENAGVFNFASIGTINPPPGVTSAGAEVYPFFSRTIGLLNGEEVPLDVGAKLTGKVGAFDVGVLDVRTGEVGALTAKNLFVGRVRRNFFQQSYVGAIYTEGQPAVETTSRTVGADMRLATSHFMGRRNVVLNMYAVRSLNEGISGRDASWGASAQYPNDRFDAQFVLREIQDNFRPALGFVQRRNVRLFRVGFSYNPRPKDFLGIQQMFHDFYYMQFTRLDNHEVESRNFYATTIDWHFKSGDAIHTLTDIDASYERLFAPFQIFTGVVLPVGEYTFVRGHVNVTTAARRKLSGSINMSYGQYWSGYGETIQLSGTYRVAPYFSVSVNSNQTFARLPEGHFVARIFTTNVNYTATPSFALFNLIQYDNQSRNLGWQSRVRWTFQRAGNDLFLVFAQGWIRDSSNNDRFTAQDTKLSTKVQYTLRF